MRLAIISFEARNGKTFKDQTINCIEQLTEYFDDSSSIFKSTVALNFFIPAENNKEYYLQKEEILSCLPPDIKAGIPLAYLAQAPANKSKISLEVHYIPEPDTVRLIPKSESGIVYLVAKDDTGKKLVFASGISPEKSFSDTIKDTEWVFGVMEKMLTKEGLDFSCIFRQWNYIEGIVEMDQRECMECQHYQLFNDVRSKYYSTAEFRNGYPAATGIGTRAGGVIVSFYASDPGEMQIHSIENPLQRAAFKYTDEVLIGDAAYTENPRSTPKFSRAKYLKNSLSSQVYISGTASIRAEKTIGVNDVIMQTRVTLNNISKLIHPETIARLDNNAQAIPEIQFYRVYIKNPEDFEAVKQVCESYFPGIPGIFLISDICRGDLLVEIEAFASSVTFEN